MAEFVAESPDAVHGGSGFAVPFGRAGIAIDLFTIHFDIFKSCILKVPGMWPYAGGWTSLCFCITGIDDENQVYFSIIVGIVLRKIYIEKGVSGITGIYGHLSRILVFAVDVIASVEAHVLR